MTSFQSKLSLEELIENWDAYTSVSRFAGSDDTMDLIFVSKRKGCKVKLIHKARLAYEPFSAVFRGKIRKTEKGSEVVGYFTKSFSDYAIVAAVVALIFYMRSFVIERGNSLNTINALLITSIIAGIFLLWNSRSVKRKYAEFICRITGEENQHFIAKRVVEKNDR